MTFSPIEIDWDLCRAAYHIGACNPEKGTGSGPTSTPGMFYHGSPNSNLAEIKSRFEITEGQGGGLGICFTQSPTLAAVYAAGRGGAEGGRIYSAELVTSAPYITPSDFWNGREMDRPFEDQVCCHAIGRGHDCIISNQSEGVIYEIMVLDPDTIRLGDNQAVSIPAKDAILRTYYLRSDDNQAEVPLLLHADKQRVRSVAGNRPRAVLIDARCSIYCRSDLWQRMDLKFLSAHIDCLIDISSGDALVLNPDRLIFPNREMLRQIRRSNKKFVG